jgi:hypothetical protein
MGVFDNEVLWREVGKNESIPFADVRRCAVVAGAPDGYRIIFSLPRPFCEVMRETSAGDGKLVIEGSLSQ